MSKNYRHVFENIQMKFIKFEMINRWSWRKNTFFCLLAGIICNQPLLFSLLSVFFPPKSDMPQRCFSFVMFSHPDLIYTCLRVVITTKDVSQNVRKKLCRKIIKFVSEFMFSNFPLNLVTPIMCYFTLILVSSHNVWQTVYQSSSFFLRWA